MYEEKLRKRINDLIEEKGLVIRSLCAIIGVEQNAMEEYLTGNKEYLDRNYSLDTEYKAKLSSLADILCEGMDIAVDTRVRAIIETLKEYYQLETDYIARSANVPASNVKEFMDGKDIDIQEKYRLCVKAYSLLVGILSVRNI